MKADDFENLEKINQENDQELFPEIPVELFWVQGVYSELSRELWCMDWKQVKEYVQSLEKRPGLKLLRIVPFVAMYQKRFNYDMGTRDKGVRLPLHSLLEAHSEPFILDAQSKINVNTDEEGGHDT